MASHVCPWWCAWFALNNPLRQWLHDPQKIVGPYVQPGMTVLDVGSGVGWFSIPMARMVGDRGRVIAVDLQQQMLNMLRRRVLKAGVADRITLHKCEPDHLGIEVQADFALAFAMVHEVPNPHRLFQEIHACLNPGGKLLLAEPMLHVSAKTFAQERAAATEVGFRAAEEPQIRWGRAAVFGKG